MSDERKDEIEVEAGSDEAAAPHEATALSDQTAEGGEVIEGEALPETELAKQPAKSRFVQNTDYTLGYDKGVEYGSGLSLYKIWKLLTLFRNRPTALPDKTPIELLGLSGRLYGAVKRERWNGRFVVNTLGDLARLSEADILDVKSLGPTAIDEVRAVLEYCGRTLAESPEPEEGQGE